MICLIGYLRSSRKEMEPRYTFPQHDLSFDIYPADGLVALLHFFHKYCLHFCDSQHSKSLPEANEFDQTPRVH